MTFTHEITMAPAFDKRSADPKKNYGVHGVDLWFAVRKDGEGITFAIFTNWMLPHVQEETDARDLGTGYTRYMFHKPQPAGVDIHRKTPQYEGQLAKENCSVTGGICYADGSGLLAEEFYKTLLEGGSAAVFKRLEEQFVVWSQA
jgi:hypothetical protein